VAKVRPWRGRICNRVAFDEAEVVGIFVVDGCGVLRMKTNSRRLGALSEIEWRERAGRIAAKRRALAWSSLGGRRGFRPSRGGCVA
jgi:hypothetical protein